jgi:hypothetical protein
MPSTYGPFTAVVVEALDAPQPSHDVQDGEMDEPAAFEATLFLSELPGEILVGECLRYEEISSKANGAPLPIFLKNAVQSEFVLRVEDMSPGPI